MIPKKCTIILEDEVNCIVGGLSKIHLKHFYETYGFFVKGYFFNPKYKLGRWDGKIRFFSAEGRTFIFLLEEIIPVIVEMEYDIDIVDKRSKKTITPLPIDETYFSHIFDVDSEGPYKLRDYQVTAVNSLLDDNGGIVIAGTGSGKTLVNAALADSYGKHGLKTITIVPSQDLIEQTKEQFEIFELDIGEFSGTVKNPNHLHTISTWQALQNTPTIMGMFDVVIVDECVSGDTRITLADGITTKPISDILIGDSILSYNTETKKTEIDIVVNTYTNMINSSNEDMYELIFDNGIVIKITGNHKLLTKKGEWIRADELSEYDDVVELSSIGNT